MRNLNKNPIAWSIATIILGYILIEDYDFEYFVVFAFSIVLAKLVEIIVLLKDKK